MANDSISFEEAAKRGLVKKVPRPSQTSRPSTSRTSTSGPSEPIPEVFYDPDTGQGFSMIREEAERKGFVDRPPAPKADPFAPTISKRQTARPRFVERGTDRGVSIDPALAAETSSIEDTTKRRRPTISKPREQPEIKRSPFVSVRGGTIEPTTKQQRFAMSGLGRASTAFFNPIETLRDPAAKPLETTVAVFGVGTLFFGGAGAAAKAPKAVKATQQTAASIQAARAAQLGTKTGKAVRVTEAAAVGIVESAALSEAGKQVAKRTASPEEQLIFQREDFRGIVGAARAEERRAIEEKGFLQQLAFEISPAFSTEKRTFEQSLREEFKAQGLKGKELDTAVSAAKRFRAGATAGEAASMLNIARISENLGRQLTAESFEQAAKKGVKVPERLAGRELLKRTTLQVGTAGVVEGGVASIAQDISREQQLSLKRAVFSAGAGGVSASLFNLGIVGTKIKAPAVSKTIETVSYLTDPFEKPGDIAADLQAAATKRLTGVAPKTPQVTIIDEAPNILIGSTGGRRRTTKKRTTAPSRTVAIGTTPLQNMLTGTPTTTRTRPVVPTIPTIGVPTQPPATQQPLIGLPPAPIIGQPPITPVPIVPQPQIPIQPRPDVPTIPTQPNIPVNVPTNIFSNVNIPTVTPQPRIPPIMPFGFGVGSGRGAGVRVGKRKTVVDELQQGGKLFNKLVGSSAFLGGGQPTRPPRPVKRKSKSKGRKKRKSQPVSIGARLNARLWGI